MYPSKFEVCLLTALYLIAIVVEIDNKTEELFHVLSKKYWPGPLTIILKANYNVLNPIITANTGYVGIRHPNHEIASKLINLSNLPIAAPSANKFCHISPVNPYHVYEDFKEFPIKIIDGGISNFCMESTVVKIINEEKKLVIFRMGAISLNQLQSFLDSTDEFKDFAVEVFSKKQEHKFPSKKEEIQEDLSQIQEAPGQFIKHYSPILDTYVINEGDEQCGYKLNGKDFKTTVLIDYNGKMKNRYGQIFGYYRDLSLLGSEEEVMHNLYDYLRWAESLENANKIVICDLEIHMKENNHLITFVDRIKKASSSKKISIIT